jgi:hypothetical protein
MSGEKTSGNVVSMAAFRALSAMYYGVTGRMGLARRAGMQFGGKRDLYEIYGYRTEPQWEDFWAKYCRQDIASRIIDAPVDATWAPRPTFSGLARLPRALGDLDKSIQLWETVARADKLAGVGRFSLLFLGLNDGVDPSKPVTRNDLELVYVRAISEGSAKVEQFETDPTNPRYGLPVVYQISLAGLDPRGQRNVSTPTAMQVHYTRVLHIVEQPLENLVYGQSRLLNVFNLLDDLQKVVGGSAEVYWMTSNRGMQVNVDPETAMSPEDMKALQTEVEEWQHELRRFVRTRGVEMKPLTSNYPNPTQVFNMLLSLVSGTTGIPQRILLGAEAGHLASDQDRSNWADRIAERRTKYAEPSILVKLVQMGQQYGFLPAGKGWEVLWPSAYRLSPMEQAEQAAQWARTAVNFSKQPQYGMPLVSVEEGRLMMGLPAQVPAGYTMVKWPVPQAQGAGGSDGNSDTQDGSTQGQGNRGPGQKNPPRKSGTSKGSSGQETD